MALTAEQKRRIRKELQRRAQAKAAWKAGGGKSKVSASMKGWAGFGADKKYKADQLAYIKSLNTSGKHSGGSLTQKQQDKWKKTMGTVKTKGAAKGKAKVETYIKNKGANVKRPDPGGKVTKKGGKTDIAGNKPAPKPKVTKTGKGTGKYSQSAKDWYKKHMSVAKTDAQKKKVRATLKAKHSKGKFG